jgi:hypothetical protein
MLSILAVYVVILCPAMPLWDAARIGSRQEWADVTVDLQWYDATAYETGKSTEIPVTNATLVIVPFPLGGP